MRPRLHLTTSNNRIELIHGLIKSTGKWNSDITEWERQGARAEQPHRLPFLVISCNVHISNINELHRLCLKLAESFKL